MIFKFLSPLLTVLSPTVVSRGLVNISKLKHLKLLLLPNGFLLLTSSFLLLGPCFFQSSSTESRSPLPSPLLLSITSQSPAFPILPAEPQFSPASSSLDLLQKPPTWRTHPQSTRYISKDIFHQKICFHYVISLPQTYHSYRTDSKLLSCHYYSRPSVTLRYSNIFFHWFSARTSSLVTVVCFLMFLFKGKHNTI